MRLNDESAMGGAVTGELLDALSGEKKPALIVTDYHLGSVDFGPDAIVAIRRHFNDPSIPGIVLTADTDIVLDGLSDVEIAYKPLNPIRLRQLLMRMTTGSDSRAASEN